jgi:Zn-dependent protease with chaperone function
MDENSIYEKTRDPKEKVAFLWLFLFAIPGSILIALFMIFSGFWIFIVPGLLVGFFTRMFFAAYLKANAIRVSENQLPQISQIAQNFCDKAGYPVPDIYIIQHNLWNAFAVKLAWRKVVVLYSGAVDSLLLKGDDRQLAWLIGHEIGHHMVGHLNFTTRFIEFCGGWCVWVYLWYKRRCELTCDNIGLLCAGNLDPAVKAIANMTVGAQLADKINIDAAEQQWEEHRKELFVKWKTLYSTHPHNLYRLVEIRKKAKELSVL